MRSALSLEFHGYCGYSLGTEYAQDDRSADLVEVCKGAMNPVQLYPDGHAEEGIRELQNKLNMPIHMKSLWDILKKESMTVRHLTAACRCRSGHGCCRDCLPYEKKRIADKAGCASESLPQLKLSGKTMNPTLKSDFDSPYQNIDAAASVLRSHIVDETRNSDFIIM